MTILLIIALCQENKDEWSIDQLTLGDNATHYCNNNRNFPLQLVYSRQLLGQYPYYWQFGFRPSQIIIDRIRQNLDKMNRYTVSSAFGGYNNIWEFLSKNLEPDQIQVYRVDPNTKLSDFLKHLSETNCIIFSEIYRELYSALRLRDVYSRVDSVWVLDLNYTPSYRIMQT